jgi:hypothetical protein
VSKVGGIRLSFWFWQQISWWNGSVRWRAIPLMPLVSSGSLGEFGLLFFHWEDCLLFYLRAIAVNPAHMTSDNLHKKVASLEMNLMDIDMLLLLISCQKSHQSR